MANAKKLPSGSYRARVYSHTENGKKVYISITARSQGEAELKAAKLKNKKSRNTPDMTVEQAIKGYIDAKEGVLSPSTIRGYRTQLRNNYSPISKKSIHKLTSEDLQIFVSSLARDVKPKSVCNIYGLLSSALAFYMPDTVFRVTLPKKAPRKAISPSDEDVQRLFKAAPPELKKAIALSAFTSLRRGEICALTFADLDGNTLHVTKDIVQASDNTWIVKDIPKTEWSYRDVILPDKVLELLGNGGKEEKIIQYKNPTSITRVFTRIRDRLKMEIRFHDLRHYFVSIGAVLGIPDTYLSDFGGWQRGSGGVMKTVYQNTIKSQRERYSDRMKEHFNNLI